MADEQSPTDSGLTPEQETVVRGLLADARHDEPVPEAVAARLDRELTRLHEDRIAPTSPVVDLGARRRGKAGRLLFAAAAIVVGGVAVGQALDGTGGGNDSPDSSFSGQDTSTGARSEVPLDAGGEAGAAQPEAAEAETRISDGVPVQLSSQSFDEQVRYFAEERNRALRQLASAADARGNLVTGAPDFDCPPAAYGKGALIPAYYDDQPAVLAFRPPVGSNRVAELLRCGTAEKLRSLTLPR